MNLTFDLMKSPTLHIEVQYSMLETTPDLLWWSMTMLSVSKWRPAADMYTGKIDPHLFLDQYTGLFLYWGEGEEANVLV